MSSYTEAIRNITNIVCFNSGDRKKAVADLSVLESIEAVSEAFEAVLMHDENASCKAAPRKEKKSMNMNIDYERLQNEGTFEDVRKIVDQLKSMQAEKCAAVKDAIAAYEADYAAKGAQIASKIIDIRAEMEKAEEKKDALKKKYVEATIAGDHALASRIQDQLREVLREIDLHSEQIDSLEGYVIAEDRQLLDAASRASEDLTAFADEMSDVLTSLSAIADKKIMEWQTCIYQSENERKFNSMFQSSRFTGDAFERFMTKVNSRKNETASQYLSRKAKEDAEAAERQKKLAQQREYFDELDRRIEETKKKNDTPAPFVTIETPSGTKRQRYDEKTGEYVDVR